jgi:hypothetical protein
MAKTFAGGVDNSVQWPDVLQNAVTVHFCEESYQQSQTSPADEDLNQPREDAAISPFDDSLDRRRFDRRSTANGSAQNSLMPDGSSELSTGGFVDRDALLPDTRP